MRLRTSSAASSVLVVTAVFAAHSAAAATLVVGPGQTYTAPCAAIAAATPGDEIDIQAGTYHDTCAINTAGLHLKGIGGQPKIDITGMAPANRKGVYDVAADNVIIENLELTGASIDTDSGSNGAGLRIESNGVVVTNCYIHDNQDGILAAPPDAPAVPGTITIEHTELKGNGLGIGCDDGNGCTHNAYINKFARLIFQFNYSHALASDNPDKGHLLKSRALESDILYNRISDEGSTGTSYEIDLPNAGLGILVGNVIEKGTHPGNPVLVAYGEEGAGTGTNMLYAAYNTLVNSGSTNGAFINVSQGALGAVHDNIFSGTGSLPSGLSSDNLSGVDAMFVDPTTYDYHLKTGSPAAGKAVAPGAASGFPLTAVFEYVDPLGAVSRAAASDVGAFELGTDVSNPSEDAGAESPDGSVSTGTGVGGGDSGTGSDAGTGTGTGTGADSGTSGGTGTGSTADGGKTITSDGGSDGDSSSDDGGCSVAPTHSTSELPFVGLGRGLAAFVARRRRARRS